MTNKQNIAALVSGFALSVAYAYFDMHRYLGPIFNMAYPFFVQDTLFYYVRALAPFVFALTWSWITLRWFAPRPKNSIWWIFGGIVIGQILWNIYMGISGISGYYHHMEWVAEYARKYPANAMAGWGPKHVTIWNFIWYSLPVVQSLSGWFDPSFLAMLSGLAAATAISLRSNRPPSQPLAKASPQDALEPSRIEDRPGHTPFVRMGATT